MSRDSLTNIARKLGLTEAQVAALPNLSTTELGYLDAVTAGTGAASKALVLGAATTTVPGNVTFNDGTTDVDIASHDGTNGLKLGGTLVTSTAAELNILDGVTATAAELNSVDLSLNTETIAEGGVVSVTKAYTKIVSTGAGAVTIAAPDATMLGKVKVIEMTGGEHDVTLALTNVQGQSSGTTATFSDINDTLVLVGGTLKWNVVGQAGIVLS